MAARTIGVDTGGTFTDLVAVDGEGGIQVAKVPSTPADPAQAILRGLADLGGLRPGDRIVHGTTVALNALLTGRTARVAFVTSRGFRDLIEVARQERPDIYALEPRTPLPLVARALRFEVKARIWPTLEGARNGESRAPSLAFDMVEEPSDEELAHLVRELEGAGVESVAVGLLHSWADRSLEEKIGAALEELQVPITLSGVLLPEHREVERFSTALVNAALAPIMGRYLESLSEQLGAQDFSILQSSGGTLAVERAAREPVRVILSGPAGGVVGASAAAAEAGFDAFVGLDMGGTSTDVAFHRAGRGEAFFEASKPTEVVRIGGHPVAVPTLDIHTIGCGGGSLVHVDAGGVLHVGPDSAGADPGPVAYGRSTRPTLTDAHVFLGHIAPGNFLGGALELDLDAVQRAFEAVGKQLGVSAVRAAQGVLEVARAAMQRAIGVMTMQRGKDPAGLPLVAFGGAGGLQAAALAGALRMRAAVIPTHPGALSAAGMTRARGLADRAHTVLEPLSLWPAERRRTLQEDLARAARGDLSGGGSGADAVSIEQALELRYRGQSFEVRVPESARVEEVFGATHERLFGYRLDQHEVELVCLRVRASVAHESEPLPAPEPRPLPETAVLGTRLAWFGESDRARKIETRIIDRALLEAGHHFEGPALVEEYSGTTLVPPAWRADVAPGGHLVLKGASPAST